MGIFRSWGGIFWHFFALIGAFFHSYGLATLEAAKERGRKQTREGERDEESGHSPTLTLPDSKFLFGTDISIFSFDSLIHGIDNLTKGNGSSSFSISNRHV